MLILTVNTVSSSGTNKGALLNQRLKLLILRRAKVQSILKLGLYPLGGDISQLPQLLLCVCETVKDEAVALTDSTRLLNQADSTAEDEDSMETDCPRSSQKDQRDGVS